MKMNTLRLYLTEEEQLKLKEISKYHENWRIRERAETLILLGKGLPRKEVSVFMNLSLTTITTTKQEWRQGKFESLPDRPRPGAPMRLTSIDQEKILEFAKEEPLSARQICAKLSETSGTKLTENIISAFLKKKNFVWKRTRHSLKKNDAP